MPAKAPRNLPPISGIIHGEATLRNRGFVGPDNGADIWVLGQSRHGQLREGAMGQELLQGHVPMRLFMRDGPDKAHAMIIQPGNANAGGGAQRAIATLGTHHQSRAELRAGGKRDGGTIRIPRDLGLGGRMHGKIGQFRQMRIERDAKGPRFHHPAEGVFAKRRMIKMERKRGGGLPRPAISHANAKDGAGFHRQPFPNAGPFQQPFGGQRNGIGAAIKGLHFHGRQRGRVNHCGLDPSAGQPGGQGGTDRPGTHHANIYILESFHRAQSTGAEGGDQA